MQRSASIDFLKIGLASLVVALHAHVFLEESSFVSFVFVNGLLRIAVPLFFMVNGFYLYGVIAKGKPFSKWVKRIALLYAGWMLIYLPFYLPTDFHSAKEVGKFVMTLFVGYFHLWYLVASLGAGIVLYLVRNRSDKQILILAILLFALGSTVQYIFDYAHSNHAWVSHLFNQEWVFRNFLLLGFPMFALGYLLAKNPNLSAFTGREAAVIATIGLALLLTESALNYTLRPIHDNFDNYASLLIVCPFVFIFFKNRQGILATDVVSKYSTAIYFIHPLLISALMTFVSLNLGTVLFIAALLLSTLVAPLLMRLNRRLTFLL